MLRLIGLGILAAFFFSSTFFLNRLMSVEGGHWAWTAALRYVWMPIFIFAWIGLTLGTQQLQAAWATFSRYWVFWVSAGTIGFGVFYLCICIAASYAPGWVVASTWQLTILASPFVLGTFFKRKVPARGIITSALIFAGIILVNWDTADWSQLSNYLLGGVLPVTVAAIAYPFGAQLVKEARAGERKWIPHIADLSLNSAATTVLLLSVGSLPFWAITLAVTQPGTPSTSQLTKTAILAVSVGLIATSLFYHARALAKTSYETAAVDATQAAEVPFALVGELVLISAILPGTLSFTGILFIIGGLGYFALSQVSRKR